MGVQSPSYSASQNEVGDRAGRKFCKSCLDTALVQDELELLMEAPRAVREAGAVGKAAPVVEGAREDSGRVLWFLWLSDAGG